MRQQERRSHVLINRLILDPGVCVRVRGGGVGEAEAQESQETQETGRQTSSVHVLRLQR